VGYVHRRNVEVYYRFPLQADEYVTCD
jgi:hypothetical protein